MPYEFSAQEPEPETQAPGVHSGSPPDKYTAVGTLDPFLPREPVSHRAPTVLERVVVAGIVLLLIGAMVLAAFLARH